MERERQLFQKVEISEEDDSVKKNVEPLEALASDCEKENVAQSVAKQFHFEPGFRIV